MKVNAESKIESHQDSQQPESRGSLNGAKCLKTVPFSPLLATCMCRHQQISSSLIFYSPSFSLALRFIDVAFDGRPIARFWFLETVARMPYFAYMTTLHLYETLGVKFFWLTSLFFVFVCLAFIRLCVHIAVVVVVVVILGSNGLHLAAAHCPETFIFT